MKQRFSWRNIAVVLLLIGVGLIMLLFGLCYYNFATMEH